MKRLPKMQLSKLFALTLVIVLLTMTFAGCSKDADPTEPSDSAATTSTQGTAPTQATEAETEPPVVTEPKSVMGTVNTDKLNVRTKANSNSPSVKKLAIGTRVEILEQLTVEDVHWGRIEEGWINLKYVTLDGEEGPVTEDPAVPDETTPAETQPQDPAASSGNGTTGTITASSLHIRKGPGTKYDSVGKVKKGDKVEILEKSGNWGKIEKGWISLKYVDLDGDVSSSSTAPTTGDTKDEKDDTVVSDGKTTALGKATIDTSALYVRTGPGTKYKAVDKVYDGETVTYYQKSGNWVRIKEGWISLKYTKDSSSSSSSTEYKTGTGKVTASSLHIRSGAGTSYDSVGKLAKGDSVEILEVKGNWGKIDKGWICLDYVKMD
ncbi:MAG: SH3 domain-containing protein [Oscillospiraceae bacterium]|nr:SH3 domain-containing protein [Oscillospiraceae bacterium]